MVSSSTAITLLPPMTPTPVRIQDDRRASRPPESTRRGTRLIVDWRQQSPPDLQAQSPRVSARSAGMV